MLKNKNNLGEMTDRVERYERDLVSHAKLADLLAIHVGRKALPQFKTDKLQLYSLVLQQYHVVEIGNSHQLAQFWAKILRNHHVQTSNQVRQE